MYTSLMSCRLIAMFRKIKQNKKPAKRLPPDLLKILQEENDRRLMRYAQLKLADHMYENYKHALESNSTAGTYHGFCSNF